MPDSTKQYHSPFQLYSPVPMNTDGDYVCPDCGEALLADWEVVRRDSPGKGRQVRLNLRPAFVDHPPEHDPKVEPCFCGARLFLVIELRGIRAPYVEVNRPRKEKVNA